MSKLINFKSPVNLIAILLVVGAISLMGGIKASASIQTNDVQTEADCRWCHGSNVANKHHLLTFNIDHFTGTTYQCLDCHPVKLDPTTNSYYTQLTRDCTLCHGNVLGNRHHLRAADGTYQCLDCHQVVFDSATQSYRIELKYIDASGTSGSGTTVSNQPPVASAGTDQSVTLGQPVNFSAAGSYDPDGSIIDYSWDFGDGDSGTGLTSSHIYSAPGEYMVTLSVTDDKGVKSTDIAVIAVNIPEHVYANEALLITSLKKYTGSDDASIKQDITLGFTDGNNQFEVSNTSQGYNVITMKTNIDSAFLSKATINMQVKSLYGNTAQTIRIYPYQSDMKNINSGYYVTKKISATGPVDVDVTPLISQMKGYGSIKFRIVCTTKSLTIAQGQFILK